ncbi:UDP-N-acetylglucosamine 2-epimerase (non-hydrolyzing) [Iocasia frigidifontis]|uniref:UDP-N-acetylglucosamine 2-epimerase (non-hydrolyzing) n=1 Tax=Iocasia fonsfrigidae TaxID=2682810 RepID=A0A8A7KNN2_9FIRM|nr:UDP-N-acetylglucosamine 2-epimerase (non-hydrolyzing) [Iocasia fonsfrigidae]QTL99654.1 UDP-N-acetylglucosamine 2-epimerase (non-hydrolyzing) [Iocasia fonsfrigidae]
MDRIKVMLVFGTRPEAIKMAPVVKALQVDKRFEAVVVVTAQHREMLDQVLGLFDINPDYDLDIMQGGQSLSEITTRVLMGLEGVISKENPDIVLVHGDTSTTFVAGLAAFYQQVRLGHVEAGLRTYNKYSPFPEEMNRHLTAVLADLHFAPTANSRENLLAENIDPDRVFVTGNTVIDAILETADDDYVFQNDVLEQLDFVNQKIILLTSHRRENLGKPMEDIFTAVRRLIEDNHDVELVFPVHLNPKVREIANDNLEGLNRVHLIEPMEYKPFVNLMARSYLVLTDSGGIQEEAPGLGKPVLVLRDTTERPEAVTAGTVALVGTEENEIYNKASLLLNNKEEYDKMANAVNPYGDGRASQRICERLLYEFGLVDCLSEEYI